MKKTLMLVLVVALAFSCFAAVLTAGASTQIEQGTKAENSNYFAKDGRMASESWDFNGDKPSNVAPRWWELSVENGTLNLTGCAPAYAMQAWYYETNTVYEQGKTYFVEFDILINEYVNGICFELFDGWDVFGTANVSEQIGIAVVNGGANATYTITTGPEVGGWGGTPDVTNGSFVAKAGANGYTHIYFEFTPRATLKNKAQMLVGIKGTDTEGTTKNAVVKFDNYAHGIILATTYYTIDWDVDYNNYTEVQQAIDGQPAWGNNIALDANWIDGTQCFKIIAGVGSANTGIGGFDQAAANLEGKKLVKHAAVTYFQYDIAVEDCTMVNIWTSGYYTAVIYDDSSWHSDGNVSGFKAQELEEGGYRLSYFIDMTENRDIDFNLNVDSANGGAVYIDNLVIAHEDYSAYLKPTAMYNYANTGDVALDFDAKGKTVTSVKLDDVALTAEDYTIADGKLTIKANKLANSELGKKYTLSVVTSASETAVTAEISQIDNRAEVTAEYKGEALAAVNYNGTTNYDQTITLALNGVAENDEVTVSGTAALASKNAGSNKVVVSNLVLAGKDAAKYKLATTSVEIDINVDKLQLTIGEATVADKTYDGTTAATVTAGTLSGVIDGDNVTVAAAGQFNSKDVATANKVNVTYTIDGTDAANYIAPVNGEVAKTISKAALTVTANAATKEEGAADPELTYTTTGLLEGDQLSGKLARAAGETAGEYDITVGTLANDNYEITFNGAKLTITAKSQPTTPDKPDTNPDEEKKGCFGVVGTASIAAFSLLAAAAVVVCKRKDK